MARAHTSAAAQWTLRRGMIAHSSCHQTYLGDMEMEKNCLQDRSGLEDRCSPLLHPWGLGAWSPPCSRSQPRRDPMELRALQLHSTDLMRGAEAKLSFKRHQNPTVTAQDWDCLSWQKGKEYICTKKPNPTKCVVVVLVEERLFSYLECRVEEEMIQQDKRFLLGTTQQIQKLQLPHLPIEQTQTELIRKNGKHSIFSKELRKNRTRAPT